MGSSTIEITVILTCGNQGRFLNPTVQSLRAAIRKTEAELSATIEWIIAADAPSRETDEYLMCHLPARSRKLLTHTGSTSAATNQAVAEAEGKFIATIGGNDLVSSNWLFKAYAESSSHPANFVFHPGVFVTFGGQRSLFVTPDQQDPDFSREVLFARNLWPGVNFASRNVFLAHPFSDDDQEDGFGHADWHWVCETVAAGVVHKPVEGTLACCRQTAGHACIAGQPDGSVLMPRSKLFSIPEPCEV